MKLVSLYLSRCSDIEANCIPSRLLMVSESSPVVLCHSLQFEVGGNDCEELMPGPVVDDVVKGFLYQRGIPFGAQVVDNQETVPGEIADDLRGGRTGMVPIRVPEPVEQIDAADEHPAALPPLLDLLGQVGHGQVSFLCPHGTGNEHRGHFRGVMEVRQTGPQEYRIHSLVQEDLSQGPILLLQGRWRGFW
jgi:hypothetical protein